MTTTTTCHECLRYRLSEKSAQRASNQRYVLAEVFLAITREWNTHLREHRVAITKSGR